MRTFNSMEWNAETVDLNGKRAFTNKVTGEIVLAERFEQGELRGIHLVANNGDMSGYVETEYLLVR
jgi:hypothetical protein